MSVRQSFVLFPDSGDGQQRQKVSLIPKSSRVSEYYLHYMHLLLRREITFLIENWTSALVVKKTLTFLTF